MTIVGIYLVDAAASTINSKDKPTVYSSRVCSQGSSKAENRAVEIWHYDWSDTKDNSYKGVDGSYYPASTDATNKSAKLCINLSYDYNLRDIPLKLVGKLAGKVVVNSSSSKLHHSQITPRLDFPAKNPGTAWGIGEDIEWTLSLLPTGQAQALQKTRVELYGLNPNLPRYFNKGVPVKLLRWVVAHAPRTLSAYTAHVADHVMNRTGFIFDSIGGASGFGVPALGSNFNLSTWLKLMNSNSNYRVNQYDQSAAVQVCLALAPFSNGPAMPWAYLSPYGYIQKTKLTGWSGDCNNSLFKEKPDIMWMKINDADRTAFVDYAFILSNDSKVVDSTIGPHLGTDTTNQYLDAAIDTTTNLYLDESKKPQTYGRIGDVKYYECVQTLDSTPPSSSANSSPAVNNRISRVMTLAVNPKGPEALHSTSDFRALDRSLVSTFSGRITNTEIRISSRCSESQTFFQSPEASVVLSAVVYEDHTRAVQGMADHLHTYAGPVESIFSRPRRGKQKGQLDIFGASRLEKTAWVRGNVFLVVLSLTEGFDIDSLAMHVDEHFGAEQVKPGEEELPQIRGLVGEEESATYALETVFSIYADVRTSTFFRSLVSKHQGKRG